MVKSGNKFNKEIFTGIIFLSVSLVCSLYIIVILIKYMKCVTYTQLRMLNYEYSESSIYPLGILSSYISIALLRKNKFSLIAAICCFVFIFLSIFFTAGIFFIGALILAFGLIYILIDPVSHLKVSLIILLSIVGMSPSYLWESSSRSIISRTRADLRSLSTALEAYHVDNSEYPAWTTDPEKKVSWDSSDPSPTFRRYTGKDIHTLTTPQAYLTSMFDDAYRYLKEGERTFAYWSLPHHYIIFSAGPDCRFDLTINILEDIFTLETRTDKHALKQELNDYTYDPTNGEISRGDVWRIGGRGLDNFVN
jgi:hypothetical protein